MKDNSFLHCLDSQKELGPLKPWEIANAQAQI